jgi:tRNA pseudouridine38-40 synthase
MRNIKLILEYDGSSFFGFQRQRGQPTVQEALEKALSELLNHKTKIQAASGRTDTGVHAEYQVVNFKTSSQLPLVRIQEGLNALLPRQIAVKKVEDMELDFHARYQARTKTYEYRIWNSPCRSPLNAMRTFHVFYPLNMKKIKRAAALLKGRHDFRSFASSAGHPNGRLSRRNTVRTIRRFEVRRQGALITFAIEGDGFLNHMVRNLIGTLIELGQGRITLADLRRILYGRDRRLAGPTAAASGLTLVNVTY